MRKDKFPYNIYYTDGKNEHVRREQYAVSAKAAARKFQRESGYTAVKVVPLEWNMIELRYVEASQ